MDWARQCAVVIPCRNEAVNVGEIVSAVRRQLPSMIVVDDGSTDGTADRAIAAGAKTLRHPANQGKNAALRTGWQRARACRSEERRVGKGRGARGWGAE